MTEKPMAESLNCALAVDPGRSKCGVAVVRRCAGKDSFETVHRSVVSRKDAAAVIRDLASLHSPDVILIGNGTMREEFRLMAESLKAAPVRIVDEKFSTLRARKRYFQDHPPRGLRKLIPVSLQTPRHPYDDYVAVLLAESFLSKVDRCSP